MYALKKLYDLEKLHELFENGSITEEDYNSSKDKIMDGIYSHKISLDDIDTAKEMESKNVISQIEFEAIKQIALEGIEDKPKKIIKPKEPRVPSKLKGCMASLLATLLFTFFPAGCSVVCFSEDVGPEMAAGWIILAIYIQIRVWWDKYGYDATINKFIISEGIRKGRWRK